MARYAMVVDMTRCVGCQACTVACDKEWNVPLGFARTHIQQTGIVGTFPKLTSSFRVAQCNQCDRPPCLEACPTGATRRGADGIVRIADDVCIGCGYCVEACPYDMRFINPETGTAEKCDFCSARLERGLQPACVVTCTAHAKYFGDLEDRSSEVFHMVFDLGARRLETEQVAVAPNVYYLGKPADVDQAFAKFAPHPPRTPMAREFWSRVARPVVLAAVGASFAGQAIAFFHQLSSGEQDEEE
ncbi:MAG: 4Fe-4S dicluster domain-containing protein [Terriglobales bacterium]